MGTAVIWAAWFLALLSIDPFTTGFFGFAIFYATLIGGLVGFITTTTTLIRAWHSPERSIEDVVTTSLRQAIILSALTFGALLLSRLQLLNWLTVLGLVLAVALLELTFIVRQKPKKHQE